MVICDPVGGGGLNVRVGLLPELESIYPSSICKLYGLFILDLTQKPKKVIKVANPINIMAETIGAGK